MTQAQLPQKQLRITFIGAGNMARSLIAGLAREDDNHSLVLRVADPDQTQLDIIRRHFPGVTPFTDNLQAVADANMVVLAVKPQTMPGVVRSLAGFFRDQPPLFVSVAAGVTVASLQQWLGSPLPVVRCMPNTPALVQAGTTGLYASSQVSSKQRSLAESLLRTVGVTLWFEEESQLDTVTAVSGSGPAYFFLVMEAMITAATGMGLTPEEARLLVVQTAFGAAKLALESEDAPAELRHKVTSKGGTTEAAIRQLESGDLAALFDQALHAAARRARELANPQP
ncbi:MAG: pyrroline-5-carboxylate reductase [Thiothrix sp.]|nr:pyrroline-5-carboxylate reductase [Thiothrix sp.]HPQ96587.1 pyrroline-5-carboxylate reductase [Thiolinea sp.]